MDDNVIWPPALAVVHTCPADLVPLLPAAAHVAFLDPASSAAFGEPHVAFEVLRVDGPLRVLALVMERRCHHPPHVPIALAPGDDSPLGWGVLDLAARHQAPPALDLRAIRWHRADGLWWANGDGPVHLPLPVDTPRGAAATAAVLLATAGLALESPLRRWLDAERTNRSTDGCAWDRALCAGYVTAALAYLSSARSTAEVGAQRS